jgi:hypothetical protein
MEISETLYLTDRKPWLSLSDKQERVGSAGSTLHEIVRIFSSSALVTV